VKIVSDVIEDDWICLWPLLDDLLFIHERLHEDWLRWSQISNVDCATTIDKVGGWCVIEVHILHLIWLVAGQDVVGLDGNGIDEDRKDWRR